MTAIIAGVAMLLDNLNMIPSHLIESWWPLLLIFMGLGKIWERGFLWSIGGQALVVFGFIFLFGGIHEFHLYESWWPLLLVYLGVLITLRSLMPRPPKFAKSEILQDSDEMKP